jgi:exopolyphosphatase/guanosine-5'-triphosphate,3'-diphosphate pyrophosphatase
LTVECEGKINKIFFRKSVDKRYAVFEIGTRGVRLLVADASPNGISQIVFSTGGLSELGSGRDQANNISEDVIARVHRQAEEYLSLAREHGAEEIFGFATEAVRSAANRAEFLAALAPVCNVEILDSDQEARYSFLASVEAFKHVLHPDESVLVVDQGGGSLELACGSLDKDSVIKLQGFDSLPLGTVELTRQFAEARSLRDGFENASRLIHSELERHKIFPLIADRPPTQAYGLGSAITELAKRLHKDSSARKSLQELHGLFIPIKIIRDLVAATDAELNAPKSRYGDRVGVDGDKSTLLGGVLTYHQILEKYRAEGITVNRRGLRFGVLLGKAGYPYRIDLLQQANDTSGDSSQSAP